MALTNEKILRNTGYSKDGFAWALERAVLRIKDLNKDSRIKEQECRYCFYQDRIGGAAMTNNNCENCEKEMMFGSTSTDCTCLACAQSLGLCKHCGGDIDMKTKRDGWIAQ